MKRTEIVLACLLIATPAFAQSVGEKTGVNSALGLAPTTADFVKEIAISDMFEIASSQLAQEKGTAAEKTFATMMVVDHTKTSNELKSLVSSGKVDAKIPAGLDEVHQSKLNKLTSANGQDFALAFQTDQVNAHKNAVHLFERYARSGENAELKSWAGQTLPALKHHLDMAQNLKK